MVIEDDSEHMVYLINANSFSYKQMMYKLSDGYSFESLLAKTSQKKEKRNVRIEFSSDFFLFIDLDESAPLTNDYLTKISISMLLNCGKDRTPLFSIYSDEERTKKVEDFSLTDNITLYGVF